MNPFQKQLLVKDVPLPFHEDLNGERKDYGEVKQPCRVSIEEFERDLERATSA